ncbi:uncharacterized protein LOC119779574 [Cyprinodon tularosa]|uniref:uncharacterized protein LOC119779574 n=1 Tax=Cyprinodon tularosa TaxID=77115 RepID=UPI0018E22C70|nr:uncharacterized protein LOC119779574 [Cyprinodon tularosa]
MHRPQLCSIYPPADTDQVLLGRHKVRVSKSHLGISRLQIHLSETLAAEDKHIIIFMLNLTNRGRAHPLPGDQILLLGSSHKEQPNLFGSLSDLCTALGPHAEAQRYLLCSSIEGSVTTPSSSVSRIDKPVPTLCLVIRFCFWDQVIRNSQICLVHSLTCVLHWALILRLRGSVTTPSSSVSRRDKPVPTLCLVIRFCFWDQVIRNSQICLVHSLTCVLHWALILRLRGSVTTQSSSVSRRDKLLTTPCLVIGSCFWDKVIRNRQICLVHSLTCVLHWALILRLRGSVTTPSSSVSRRDKPVPTPCLDIGSATGIRS